MLFGRAPLTRSQAAAAARAVVVPIEDSSDEETQAGCGFSAAETAETVNKRANAVAAADGSSGRLESSVSTVSEASFLSKTSPNCVLVLHAHPEGGCVSLDLWKIPTSTSADSGEASASSSNSDSAAVSVVLDRSAVHPFEEEDGVSKTAVVPNALRVTNGKTIQSAMLPVSLLEGPDVATEKGSSASVAGDADAAAAAPHAGCIKTDSFPPSDTLLTAETLSATASLEPSVPVLFLELQEDSESALHCSSLLQRLLEASSQRLASNSPPSRHNTQKRSIDSEGSSPRAAHAPPLAPSPHQAGASACSEKALYAHRLPSTVCPISSEGFPAATSTQGKRVEGGDVSMGGLGRRGSWLLLYVRCALEVPSLSAEGAREERGGAPPEAGEASPPRRVGEETATAPPLPLLPLEKEEDPPTDFLLPLEQRRAGVSVQSQLEKASSQGCSTAGDDVQGACVLLFRRMLAVHSDFYADPSGGSSCAGENTLHVERGGVEVGALKRFFLGCVGEGWQGGTSQEGTSREGTSREGTSQGGTSQTPVDACAPPTAFEQDACGESAAAPVEPVYDLLLDDKTLRRLSEKEFLDDTILDFCLGFIVEH
ncbi:uncharacterized protein LOC34618856, partial [Cyclospora cayetanensis]|uniref:Uncharacterized protein LOC34618856 n=1 Tax=Cyclospora cayetanensis TaxID=88456 RepID=A0A6P6RTJ2_9EIME